MKTRPLAVLIIVLACASSLAAQSSSVEMAPGTRVQPFFFEVLNFANYDEFGLHSHLDLYVHIPYDLVTFIKKEEFYRGSYTLTAMISDSEGSHRIKTETREREIKLLDFQRTNNPRYYDLSQYSLNLEPGSYLLEILFEDNESQQQFRISRKVESRSYSENLFGMSDFMLVRGVEYLEGKRQITPQIDPNVASLPGGFDMFFEIYNPFLLNDVVITHTISLRGQKVFEKTNRQGLKKGLNTFLSHISTEGFTIGIYSVRVTVNRTDDSTSSGVLARGERQFIIEWLSGGSPISILDLDEAISQLQYFADDDDQSYLKNAANEEEKRARFEEFWERHNPTPGSSKNAAMIEYYSRVSYANQHFGHYIDGWRTDRGMIYILYGKPDYVDRHPLDTDSKPYEVWEYYDVRKRFTFIDESGFGDYRLLYPVWDERNRMR